MGLNKSAQLQDLRAGHVEQEQLVVALVISSGSTHSSSRTSTKVTFKIFVFAVLSKNNWLLLSP